MTDIVEVTKVDKDENWMDGVLLHIYHLLQFLQVLVRCEKEEKIACKCFSTTRYQRDIV